MIGFILAALGGAGLMYFLDPTAGRRRRALVRDQLVKARHQLEDTSEAAQKQAANKAQGVIAETRSRMQQTEVDDYTLAARVRSEMGRVVSHSHAIDASIYQGRVTLRGNILAHEVDNLMRTVRSVPGVKDVDNQLQVHTEPGNIPDLQGSPREFDSSSQM
jgi:osmotically-inducible protein OsmY